MFRNSRNARPWLATTRTTPRRPLAPRLRSSSSSASAAGVPSVATSAFLAQSRQQALSTPGLMFRDAENVRVGIAKPGEMREVSETDLDDVEMGGRDTKKMNYYQAVRDAMSITLTKDDKSLIFGEDVFFGGVFRYA
ncbi:2-oxoisovalerate dehydrogenase E1 component, beta subunit [Pseudohyphozyma bogoriensis]|nr:2-oxoisovalerate dehydrogenase E1 component, beta subunit [Pseudohyphozyma bogoriensis]